MSETKEMQDDEREAMISIYEGDPNFKELTPTSYQYKYGEDDNNKSFLVELTWGENYPNDLPTFNMDTFFNRNLLPAVKQKIISSLTEEANQWLGCGMTYTLFEYIKDHLDEMIVEQPDIAIPIDITSSVKAITISTNDDTNTKAPKKEQLTKAQKRRQWERTDHKGDRERGWNWVDIVKHLSQTGVGKEKGESSNSFLVT